MSKNEKYILTIGAVAHKLICAGTRCPANQGERQMMKIPNTGCIIFYSSKAAEKTISIMEFKDGETRIIVDPKGSGRCYVEVLDPKDGAVIGCI
jgi:hypothetical protein